MAESAPAEPGVLTSPTGGDVKEESTGGLDILEGLEFPSMSPTMAMKRPFADVHTGDQQRNSDPKKVKTETGPAEVDESFEDGLALLVQNALSNVDDLVDGFDTQHHEAPAPTTETIQTSSEPPQHQQPHHEHHEDMVPLPAPVTFEADPDKYMRNLNIHALGGLSISILLILTQKPLDDTIKRLRDTNSSHAHAYRRLRSAFEAAKTIYSTTPILFADQLAIIEEEARTIIELANLAQLSCWLAEGGESGFSHADEHLASAFQSSILDLPPKIIELYLIIKSQRAIQALLSKPPEKPAEETLHESMIRGVEDKLKGRRSGMDLTSSDRTFFASVQARKAAFQAAAQQGDVASLKDRYPADDALKSLGTYTRSRLTAATDLANRLGHSIPPNDDPVEPEPMPEPVISDDMDLDDLSSFFEKTASGLVQNALAGLSEEDVAQGNVVEGDHMALDHANGTAEGDGGSGHTNGKIDLMTDYKELEALVAESTSNYVKTTLHGLSPVPYQPTVPTSTTENMAAQAAYLNHYQQHSQHPFYSHTQPAQESQPQPTTPGGHLPPNQTCTSAMLYDKARQAALTKSSSHTRREGLHSTRRPWTQEEEKALMAGLDMVKGPHWSQILTLFGPNGTISDILKERTQVQLKDKARNLKLFFLKTNSEMPYYLQAVTGELKTRAPTQAARKEAEERARLNSEEDQAKLQGILALAGGLHAPQSSRGSSSPARSVAPAVVTPAQAAQAASASHSGQQSPAMQGTSAARPITSAPAPATNASTPATATATAPGQNRLNGQTSAQHALQAIAQAHPRPQGQIPPIPRPQAGYQQQPSHQQHQPQPSQHNQHQQQSALQQTTQPQSSQPQPQPQQQQQQQQQRQQQQHLQSQPQQPSPAAASYNHPQFNAQHHHQQQVAPAPAQQTAQTAPQPAVSHHESTTSTATASPNNYQAPAAPASASQHPSEGHSSQLALPQPEHQHHDDATEAALLQGLQAAVAEATT